uniref:Uncharacterized protein n=1 Tax=Romanomermis culicivorax TaxID=13658 RepID=A0A915I4C5_ROMCU
MRYQPCGASVHADEGIGLSIWQMEDLMWQGSSAVWAVAAHWTIPGLTICTAEALVRAILLQCSQVFAWVAASGSRLTKESHKSGMGQAKSAFHTSSQAKSAFNTSMVLLDFKIFLMDMYVQK